MEVYVMVVLDGATEKGAERPDSPGKVEVFTDLRSAQRSVCQQVYQHLLTLAHVNRSVWNLETRVLAVRFDHLYHIHEQNDLDDHYTKVMEAYNNAPDGLVHTLPSFWIHKRTVKEA